MTNTGPRAGADVPQAYLTDAAGERRMRLLGFERVELKPGESKTVTIAADPRLLARFNGKKQQWRLDEGEYAVALSRSADAPVECGKVWLEGRVLRTLIAPARQDAAARRHAMAGRRCLLAFLR